MLIVQHKEKIVWISKKVLFQCTDNPEREFKLWNVCAASETVNVIVFFQRTGFWISPPINFSVIYSTMLNNNCKDGIFCGAVENSQPNKFNVQVLMVWAWQFIIRHHSHKHHNQQVEISLFCTGHLIGWIWKCWNLLFRFCLLIGFHCLGGPGFSKRTVIISLLTLFMSLTSDTLNAVFSPKAPN